MTGLEGSFQQCLLPVFFDLQARTYTYIRSIPRTASPLCQWNVCRHALDCHPAATDVSMSGVEWTYSVHVRTYICKGNSYPCLAGNHRVCCRHIGVRYGVVYNAQYAYIYVRTDTYPYTAISIRPPRTSLCIPSRHELFQTHRWNRSNS
jgi:hypothetical protein